MKATHNSGWLDIETAPKDGTLVDLWHEDYGRMTDTWWDGCWVVTGTIDGFTHWMKIPEPPNA